VPPALLLLPYPGGQDLGRQQNNKYPGVRPNDLKTALKRFPANMPYHVKESILTGRFSVPVPPEIGLLCWQVYDQYFDPSIETELETIRDKDGLGFPVGWVAWLQRGSQRACAIPTLQHISSTVACADQIALLLITLELPVDCALCQQRELSRNGILGKCVSK
jgi:hypothetical protein